MGKFEAVSKEEVIELLARTVGDLIPHLPYSAKNFMVATTICGAVIKFTANIYEWELDVGIGMKRFRDMRFGPWTAWRSIEA